MNTKTATKNPIELHREMYERRCREISWYHGQSLKQVIERVNTLPMQGSQMSRPSKNGEKGT